MRIQFKVQSYQTDAVDNVMRVFDGQPYQGASMHKGNKDAAFNAGKAGKLAFTDYEEDSGYKNADVTLSEEELLKNIHQIQASENIKQSSDLVRKLGHCQLDVEMETGTGKTYVYIKTMFEMNRRFGWTKFIVVVPSIAIREGVKKSFDITSDHFMELYGKKARYFIYNSDNLTQIDTFSQSADISVMIINTQAFNSSLKEGANNKAARIIYDKRDQFGSRRPIDVIAANRPIVILDEPQKMGGAATQTALARFNPLFTLNYSATHRETHNPVYVLDALDAYNKRLVKQIEVVGFDLENLKGTDSYVYFEDIIISKDHAPRARLEFEFRNKSGNIKRILKNLSEGDDLYRFSGGLAEYKGFVISEIKVNPHAAADCRVTFGNGMALHVKEAFGNVTSEYKARIQIRETIKAHLRKEAQLFKRGIKCLSLFFIDEVANYRQYDEDGKQKLGRYGEIFEEEYKMQLSECSDLSPDYMRYLSGIDAHETHSGYFSIDKKGRSVNSEIKRGSDTSDDISAYDLILKNKERLLSFDEPVRFIFSHSALREGWDNPNVFQICSLRQAGSVSQKRQEVGRGLRLCVNERGVRQDSDVLGEEVQKINRLTVIASEGYAEFVADLQKKIREDLYDRPTKADTDYFMGRIFVSDDGKTMTVDKGLANEIYCQLRVNGYITPDGSLTGTFREALAENRLALLKDRLAPYTAQIYRQVQSIFDPHALDGLIEDGSKPQILDNRLNDNFSKKEFQELWHRINHKYAYKVNFDSAELIEKAVAAIDRELVVSELHYVVTSGIQKDILSGKDMQEGNMLGSESTERETLRAEKVTGIKYDLLGAVASKTKLTRKTAAEILSKIRPSKFSMYAANPEEFIQKVSRLILEQKSTIIVERISYNQVNGEYSSDIFTQEKHSALDRAYEGKKSIVDYVFTDGTSKTSIERQFVEQLDAAKEVVVYAKLPKGFHIPTPVGNYTPDWAIAFEEGRVNHVYFVAETKGSMSSLNLRGIESGKIACAEKLFEQLSSSDVRYGKIDSFKELMNLVRSGE